MRETLDAYFAAVNEDRYEDVAKLFAPDATLTAPGIGPLTPQQIPAYLAKALAHYPRHHDEPTRIVEAQHTATVEITFTGVRPGERMHEILFAREEETGEVGIPGIVAARPLQPSLTAIREWLAALERGVVQSDRAACDAVLRAAVPEFAGRVTPDTVPAAAVTAAPAAGAR